VTFFGLLTDRCDVYRYVESGRTQGVPVFAASPALTGVSCRLSGVSGREVEGDAETLVYTECLLFLPPGTDIRTGDKVVVAGQEFRALPPRPAGRHHLEVPLQRVWER